MKKVLLSGIVNTPNDISIAPDAFKNHLNVMYFQNWRSKALHGQYVNSLYDINSAHSFGWLTCCDLKIETESLVFAAQDQALNTNYYSNRILGGPNATCRLCGSSNETVAHIVSGCSFLEGTLYKKRHDVVGVVCIGICVLSLVFQLSRNGGSIIPGL